ncbi:MAG: sulfite dehydrogenase [Burkholderiales bacterium]
MRQNKKNLPAASDLEIVADNGLLHRRVFFKQVAATGATMAVPAIAAENLTTPPWMQKPGLPFSNYGQPSKQVKTIRRITANRVVAGNGSSWTPLDELEGVITPTGLHFERHHNGVPEIDAAQHKLLIHGLVKQPLTFSVDNLLRYPMTSKLIFLECGGNSFSGWHQEPLQTSAGNLHGLASCNEWTGVPVSVLLNEAGVDGKASWVIAEGADAIAHNMSLPLEKLMQDAIIALYQNGERLRPENGFPLRLIVPGWEGVLNVKWLRRFELSDQPIMSRNETSQYTELLPSGKARQFTFVMEAKSLITSPSLGYKLRAPGFYQISGLAWSGRGKISKVEVSADGGKSWGEAAMQGPVLPQCFTRFRMGWNWDGKAAILKSRATDESGYVQPEREALIQERGRHGYFHYNGIVAWEIDDDGSVAHVYA